MDETLVMADAPPVEAAETVAADAAAVAAAAAAVAVEAAAEAPPEASPDAQLAADIEIARQMEETERARIDARMQIKIAEIQAEQNEWRSNIEASLAMIAARVAAMETIPLTQEPPSAETVIVNNPEAPTIVPPPQGDAGALPEAETNQAVEPEAEAAQTEAAPPARQRRRWI